MRQYEVMVKRAGHSLPFQLMIAAEDRRTAVYKAEQWFWRKYKVFQGPIHLAVTVSDPYSEVHYSPTFSCCDRINKLLARAAVNSLIAESKGELALHTREGKPHGQHNPVCRVKRRRDFGKFVAPGIRHMRNGVLYYRIITAPQRSRNGRRFRKRKYRDIRLTSRTLTDAVNEIWERRLNLQNEERIARRMKVRDLSFVAYVAGLINLSPQSRARFHKVLPKYEAPRTRASPMPPFRLHQMEQDRAEACVG